MFTSPAAYIFSQEKRMFDIAAGSVLATIAAPVEAAAMMAIRDTLCGESSYFEQERFGLSIRKLRTMRSKVESEQERSIWDSSSLEDPRIFSRLAVLLRRSRVDELPQLRQVVRDAIEGKPDKERLSLVGLRPLLKLHVSELYNTAKAENHALAERWMYWMEEAPKGVVSPAALHYAGRISNKEIDVLSWMEQEDHYCRQATMLTDVSLLWRTAGMITGLATAKGQP